MLPSRAKEQGYYRKRQKYRENMEMKENIAHARAREAEQVQVTDAVCPCIQQIPRHLIAKVASVPVSHTGDLGSNPSVGTMSFIHCFYSLGSLDLQKPFS